MEFCKKCVMPDTRPRLTFNEDGVCAACEWSEEKKTSINWAAREKELINICDSIRGKQKYDCLIPVSGGKDSTYVAHKMKHVYGLNVLTVTITPPLETKLIQDNLNSFLNYGYSNIKVTPNPHISKTINKIGLIEQGRPLLSWTTCLNSTILQLAVSMGIPLIMFGEEGESEYGGTKKLRYSPYYSVEDAIDIYTYGNDPSRYIGQYSKEELSLWMYPSKDELSQHPIKVAHWSYFENWDSYKHYEFAKENYGMKSKESRSKGTYTNFSQLDSPLYDLHAYMMYLKFGFGRCLQDVCIDVRAGRLTRENGVELIKKYDGEYPELFIEQYLDYYEMAYDDFQAILDKHVNKKLFEKQNNRWTRKFEIK